MLDLDQKDHLRFKVGDRVECISGRWTTDTVVKLFYTQSTFPPNECAPYQIQPMIQLDNGRLIFAPFDEDRIIRKASTNLEALQPELLALIMQWCGVSELMRLRQVSKGWCVRADADEAWTSLIHDFDPLQLSRRSHLQMLRDGLGTWAAVGRVLASRCISTHYRPVAQYPNATTPDSVISVSFVLPNRWIFRPPQSTLCGHGSVGSGKMLRRVVSMMEEHDSLCLSGSFILTKSLTLKKNVRLVGKDGEGAAIRLYARGIRVQAACMLKNLTIHATHNHDLVAAHQAGGACLGAECPECDDHRLARTPGACAHAIVVCAPEGVAHCPAHGLIAEDLHVTSTIGCAVSVKTGARASLTRCALSCDISWDAVQIGACTLSLTGCSQSICFWEPRSDGWDLVRGGPQKMEDRMLQNTTTLPGQPTGHQG